MKKAFKNLLLYFGPIIIIGAHPKYDFELSKIIFMGPKSNNKFLNAFFIKFWRFFCVLAKYPKFAQRCS